MQTLKLKSLSVSTVKNSKEIRNIFWIMPRSNADKIRFYFLKFYTGVWAIRWLFWTTSKCIFCLFVFCLFLCCLTNRYQLWFLNPVMISFFTPIPTGTWLVVNLDQCFPLCNVIWKVIEHWWGKRQRLIYIFLECVKITQANGKGMGCVTREMFYKKEDQKGNIFLKSKLFHSALNVNVMSFKKIYNTFWFVKNKTCSEKEKKKPWSNLVRWGKWFIIPYSVRSNICFSDTETVTLCGGQSSVKSSTFV